MSKVKLPECPIKHQELYCSECGRTLEFHFHWTTQKIEVPICECMKEVVKAYHHNGYIKGLNEHKAAEAGVILLDEREVEFKLKMPPETEKWVVDRLSEDEIDFDFVSTMEPNLLALFCMAQENEEEK